MTYDADMLRDMIPQYVNGHLEAEETRAFEKGLAEHPELAAELAEYEAIRDSYDDVEKEIPFPQQDLLFDRIMSTIEREEASARPPARAVTAGFADKLADLFRSLFASPRLAWSVVAVQVVLLVTLLAVQPDQSRYQTLTAPGTSSSDQPVLNVVFDEKASEKEIRALLLKTATTIIDGPSREGLYILATSRERSLEDIAEELAQSDLVIFVEQRY